MLLSRFTSQFAKLLSWRSFYQWHLFYCKSLKLSLLIPFFMGFSFLLQAQQVLVSKRRKLHLKLNLALQFHSLNLSIHVDNNIQILSLYPIKLFTNIILKLHEKQTYFINLRQKPLNSSVLQGTCTLHKHRIIFCFVFKSS